MSDLFPTHHDRRTRRSFLKSAAASLAAFPGLASVFAQEHPAADLQPKPGPIDYTPAIEALKKIVAERMEKDGVKSLAVALVDGQRTVWSAGFGFTDEAKTKPVTADTVFNTQSVTKTYTATAFLVAATKGWLGLDEPLRKYLPDFTIKSRFGPGQEDKMTFRHLLSHWAGLPHEAPVNSFTDEPHTFEEHVKSIPQTWLRFPVGKTFCYSNLGIHLAGYVLQHRAGKPFAQFMKDELLTALGMTRSTYSLEEAQRTSFVRGDVAGKLEAGPMVHLPAAGLNSSVNDMAKFLAFHLAGGVNDGKRLIDERLLKEMYTPQFPEPQQYAGYGLGIAVMPVGGAPLLYHTGGGNGYKSIHLWSPALQVGLVVLSNDSQASPISGLIPNTALAKMIEAKFTTPPRQKIPKVTDKPIVEPDEAALRKFEGTYVNYQHQQVTFKVQDKRLYMGDSKQGQALEAHAATEFVLNAGKPDVERITFEVDAAGKPTFVRRMYLRGIEFYVPNELVGDPPGPNRPEWSEYVGEYHGKAFRNPVPPATIVIKNGYLCTGEGVRLGEHKPGLFFMPDGDSVIFEKGRMLIAYRPYTKVK